MPPIGIFDPRKESYGSPEDWIRAAEALVNGYTILAGRPTSKNPDLAILNLDDFPADIDGLKRAFRNSLFLAHPDHGGTDEATRDLLGAFDRLKKFYRKN